MIDTFAHNHPWLYRKIKKSYWSFLNHYSKHNSFIYRDNKLGIKIRLNSKDNSVSKYIYLDSYEKETISFINRYLLPGDIIYDIGANIGYYTLISSKLVGKTGRVHSFEPSFREFSNLTENIRLNYDGNIYLNQFALSDQQGIIEMSVQVNSAYGAYNTLGVPSHKNVENTAYKKELVRTTTLDIYSSSFDNQKPSLIKVDVEGAELSVLRGGYKLLSHNASPTLIIEICEQTLKGFGTTPAQITKLLTEYGYLLFSILQNGSLIAFDENISLNLVAIKDALLHRLNNADFV